MNPFSHHRPALSPPDWCLVLLEIQNRNTVLFRRRLLRPYQNCCIRWIPLTNFVSALRIPFLFRLFRMSIQEQIIMDCCSRDIDCFCHSSYLHPLQTGSIAHVLPFFPFSSYTTFLYGPKRPKPSQNSSISLLKSHNRCQKNWWTLSPDYLIKRGYILCIYEILRYCFQLYDTRKFTIL